MEKFDLIIVGGGLAGLSVAASFPFKGKILLLEKEERIDSSDNPVGVTFLDTIEKFHLEEAVINFYKVVSFHTEKVKTSFNYKDPVAALLDLEKSKRILRENSFCEIRTGVEVIKVFRENKVINLVDINGRIYQAPLVIDATGNASLIASFLGLKFKKDAFAGVLTVVLESCEIKNSEEVFILQGFDSLYNGGGWIYPFSKEKCQIGVSSLLPYELPSRENLRARLSLLMREDDFFFCFKNARENPSTFLYKFSPRLQPLIPMITDNLLVVGDAAGQATSFIGEGIRPALEMGKIAGEIASEALSKGNFSKTFLKKYEDIWWERFGKYNRWSIRFRSIAGPYFKKDHWHELFSNLKKLSSQEFYKVLRSEYNSKIARKILSLKLIYRLVTNIIFPPLKFKRAKFSEAFLCFLSLYLVFFILAFLSPSMISFLPNYFFFLLIFLPNFLFLVIIFAIKNNLK